MTPAPTETPSPIPTTPSTDAHQPPDRFGAHTRLLTTTKKRRLLLPLTPLAHAPPARQPRPPHPAPQPPHLKPRSFFLSVGTRAISPAAGCSRRDPPTLVHATA